MVFLDKSLGSLQRCPTYRDPPHRGGPRPARPGVRFELPRKTRSGRRIKPPSKYNESIGRDFRHWKGSDDGTAPITSGIVSMALYLPLTSPSSTMSLIAFHGFVIPESFISFYTPVDRFVIPESFISFYTLLDGFVIPESFISFYTPLDGFVIPESFISFYTPVDSTHGTGHDNHVQEMTSVLREWGVIMKNLYVSSSWVHSTVPTVLRWDPPVLVYFSFGYCFYFFKTHQQLHCLQFQHVRVSIEGNLKVMKIRPEGRTTEAAVAVTGTMGLRTADTKKNNNHKKSSDNLRRPFGIAVPFITLSTKSLQWYLPNVRWGSLTWWLTRCGDKDFLDNVIRKLSGGGGGSSSGVPKEPKEQGLWICLKLLHGDQRQVTEENPHLVSSYTAVARKMGFPEVILPDPAMDLNLGFSVLYNHIFKKGVGGRRECTQMVLSGVYLQGVITYGAGADLMDEYKSVIYYHEDKPKWMETFKIAIPIEEFYSAHLKFTFKHRSSSEAKDKVEKPFALSYVKLMQENGTTLKDETHELLVYKRVDRMDEKNETQDAEEYTAEGDNNPATTSDRVTHRTEIEVQSFDGTYPAAQFFRTYDQKTDWDGLTNTEKVLRLPRYLNNKPLEHFRRLRMETQHYIQVRQTFLDLYPETNEATYAQYFSMKLAGQPNLEEYYRNKTALGLQLGLPQEVILETLTEGLPPSDQRLVRIVPPENLGAWFRLVQRIRGSGAPSPRHPDEHAPPLLGPYAPVRPSPRTVPTRSTPPTDCRFCGGLHWHSECRLRQAPQLPRASGDARAARSAQLAEQRPRAQPHHQASRAQATGITKGAPDQQPTDNQPQPPYPPQFPALLRQYQHVFSRNKFVVPCLKVPPVRIATNSDKVVTIRPYRVPICDQREIRSQIRQMLDNDIIEPSYSPFSSPVTLVTKRDKTKRFCIDYRKVNEVISSDVHPLPRIEDILDRLARAKYFSTADVSSAYWQVPIHPDSRPLLAFATIDGLYQPTRLPFGLKTSPQIYERAINQVLQGHGLDCVAHYFDDFVIYSETLEEHQEHLRKFFAFCDAENLQLNLTKCEFFRQTIEFLGYTITAGTTTPLIRNTDVIHAIPPPNNRKTLQSFLGAVNVYNKFIPDYARLRTPLNNLLKKDVTWDWDDKCQKAFTSLKESLTQHPVLHLYKDELPCQVYCDASTLGIAGVLKQVHSAGKAYPVQYFSRALRVHERNYTISELECLAIVESVEKFRVYLMGRKFTIFSDHHALQWLKTIKNPSGRLFRWSLRLSCYEYEVRYIKGALQHEADLLSRNPFCGFLDATLLKNHQLTPSGESKLTIDRNGLQTLKRRGVTKIVVPDALVPDLLTKVHSRYNHPGISQMTRLISPQYYWKGMSEDISKTTKACAICQSTKPPRGPTFGELGQLPVATQPFDLVALDTIAGLAKYGNAKAYLHVVVDHFSRYTWTFPSKSTSITTYQQVIKRVLQDGSPKRLLTDRAPAFTSPKFRKFLINRNIHPLLTTSNNPQANGLCERLNATLTGKLRLLHLENPKAAWTKLAKRVTVVYNNTPHSVTGFPPGYLMFGVLPPELTEHVNPYPVLTTARRIAHERTQAKHLKDKHAYDQQHKTPHFEPGDLVLVKVYHHPNTGKLAPYFTGPYEILEIISPNVVRINRPNQPLNRNTDTVHVNKLQYYNENIRYIAPPTLIPHPAKPQSRTLPPLFEHLTPDLFKVERFAPTIGNCTTTTPVDPQCNIIAQRDIPQPAISRPTHITKVKTPIPTVRADPKPIPLQARFFHNVKTFPLFHLLYLINLFILPTVLLPMATLLYVSVYTLQPNRLFQLQEALFEITIAVVELIHRTIGIILPELWTILVHSHALVALIGEIIGEIFQTLFRARQVE
ncbi:hypothetical protein LAZ67_6000554 [Cordylochernes scorpioides]|uniref:RNA-directed DNA polymerase n=1 Tax=Cordylochernes scorpioides TaxID=51811 RepID=A0ABY6KJS4_9ARAC|nr:hypothetical protein LAZ67_6000554 [Cordylochernes scorpioides]